MTYIHSDKSTSPPFTWRLL